MTALAVGLTGGLASGKSTLGRWLAEAGFSVHDSDGIVADLYRPGAAGSEAVRELFGDDEFRAMKKSAFLINTARGGLVDSQALADALANGEIAAAAIDVLPEEPPVDGDPLLDYDGDNLIVTPHIAWATDEARQNAIDELAAKIEE